MVAPLAITDWLSTPIARIFILAVGCLYLWVTSWRSTSPISGVVHSILNALRDRDKLKGRCGKCRRRWLCGGCRGVAFAVTGDYLNEDPQCFRHDTITERLFTGRL